MMTNCLVQTIVLCLTNKTDDFNSLVHFSYLLLTLHMLSVVLWLAIFYYALSREKQKSSVPYKNFGHMNSSCIC